MDAKKTSLKILKQLLKTLFIRIPILLAGLILLVLVVLKIYLTPERTEGLITENFNSRSNGSLSMKVKEFSPYGGFAFENITVKNGKEFGESNLLTIDRLVFKYGLFRMLTGSVRLSEIGIYNPRVYLEQRKGVWNASVLMKKSPDEKKEEKKEPKEKDKKDKSADDSKYIDLPISADFFLKFILNDLRVYVKSDEFKTSIIGITFTADIEVPPFKRIPKSVEAVSLLKEMKIQLNPREEMDFYFYSKDADLAPPLVLSWKLLFDKADKANPKFESSFKFGTYKTPVRFKRLHLAPLWFMISYDLYYNPYGDVLTLNHFSVKFKESKWVNLSGTVKDVTTKQLIDIRMTESNIALSDFYPYFVSFTGDKKTKFGGNISLFPFYVKGTADNLSLNGAVALNRVFFSNPSIYLSLPLLKLDYGVDKMGDDMKIAADLNIPYFTYALNGAKSGGNGFSLKSDINAYNNFSNIAINKIDLRFFSPALNRDALFVNLTGRTNLKPSLSGNIKINRFTFQRDPLAETLPEKLKKQVAGSIPLKKPLDMNLSLDFDIGKNIIKAALAMLVKTPDYGLDDLALNLSLSQNNAKKTVNLHGFSLGSKKWNAGITSSGFVELKEAPISNADLKFSVKMNNPELKSVFGPWMISGLLELQGAFKGDMKTGTAHGNFVCDKFNVKNDKQKFDLADMNLNFPFRYTLKKGETSASLLEVTKADVIDNSNFRADPNFTIKSLKAAHPARREQFEFMKDFSANVGFHKNLFKIENLKTYVLDGTIYSKLIAFNLADFNLKKMEFAVMLDVTNIDISKLDNPDPKLKKRDAELSMNANFSGRGVDIKKELSWQGYINIYEIGEKFAAKLMKGLSPKKGNNSQDKITEFVLENSMYIKGFEFNLDKGLVYTTVPLKRGALGRVIGIYEDRIEFERMPVQQYLRNIMREE